MAGALCVVGPTPTEFGITNLKSQNDQKKRKKGGKEKGKGKRKEGKGRREKEGKRKRAKKKKERSVGRMIIGRPGRRSL